MGIRLRVNLRDHLNNDRPVLQLGSCGSIFCSESSGVPHSEPIDRLGRHIQRQPGSLVVGVTRSDTGESETESEARTSGGITAPFHVPNTNVSRNPPRISAPRGPVLNGYATSERRAADCPRRALREVDRYSALRRRGDMSLRQGRTRCPTRLARPELPYVTLDGAPEHADLIAEWRLTRPVRQTFFVQSPRPEAEDLVAVHTRTGQDRLRPLGHPRGDGGGLEATQTRASTARAWSPLCGTPSPNRDGSHGHRNCSHPGRFFSNPSVGTQPNSLWAMSRARLAPRRR